MVAAGIIAERDTTAALIYRSLDERFKFYDALLETVQGFPRLAAQDRALSFQQRVRYISVAESASAH